MWSGQLTSIAANKTYNISSNREVSHADFLTRRNGSWHFVRRVPTEFAEFDAQAWEDATELRKPLPDDKLIEIMRGGEKRIVWDDSRGICSW